MRGEDKPNSNDNFSRPLVYTASRGRVMPGWRVEPNGWESHGGLEALDFASRGSRVRMPSDPTPNWMEPTS